MSILEKLRATLINPGGEGDGAVEEKRLHARYPIGDVRIAYLSFDDKERLPILNLSFTGMAVSLEGKGRGAVSEFLGEEDSYVWARLNMLFWETDVYVSKVFLTDSKAGFIVRHDAADVLLAMREPIEFMRRGCALAEVAWMDFKDQVNEEGWRLFKGESEDELRLRFASDCKTLIEASMRFVEGERPQEIVWRNSEFSTQDLLCSQHALGEHRVLTLRRDILARGIYFLTGFVGTSNQSPATSLLETALGAWQHAV